MIVITDTNFIYNALISPKGNVAKLLKDTSIQFLVPNYLLEEIEEHLSEIQGYLNRNKQEIQKEFEN
ncbi:hypothetical protein AB4865_01730 [Capnocytophaga sp. ARDL2]|uniref:hypothetical protein n=1 Tax=Capnocytophaga sp. ARDL2 TaxID=3238809 RepID=UPI003558CD0E